MQFEAGIEGLKEFRSGLKRMGDDLPKLLTKELKAAADRAAVTARRNYGRRYTSRSGKTVGTIRATATQAGSAVKFGGARVPYAAGQEFGSDRLTQFAPWTGRAPGGRGSAGRAVWPAVREEAEAVLQETTERLEELAQRTAFPEP